MLDLAIAQQVHTNVHCECSCYLPSEIFFWQCKWSGIYCTPDARLLHTYTGVTCAFIWAHQVPMHVSRDLWRTAVHKVKVLTAVQIGLRGPGLPYSGFGALSMPCCVLTAWLAMNPCRRSHSAGGSFVVGSLATHSAARLLPAEWDLLRGYIANHAVSTQQSLKLM